MTEINIKTIQQIRCQEWDRVVQEVYGKPYCYQQQDGCKDRGIDYISTSIDEETDYSDDILSEESNWEESDYGTPFCTWIDTEPKEYPRLYWERNFYPHVNMIANDLYKKGILPEGIYQIVIDW